MSQIQKGKLKSAVRVISQILRITMIAVLAVLVLSLFIASDGSSGFTALAFFSPNQSPPPHEPNGPPDPPPGQANSPPGQFNSPPGAFNSPPGAFNSPPGHAQSPLPPGQQGNGGNNGASRHVSLSYVSNLWVYSPQATGKVWVSTGFPDDHPKWPGFPPSIGYQIDQLECRDFGFDRNTGNTYEGRWFYTLYMTLADGVRMRLQSFNTGCAQFSHESVVYLPDIPEDALFEDELLLEVYLELDDAVDMPFAYPGAGALIMIGEDSAN